MYEEKYKGWLITIDVQDDELGWGVEKLEIDFYKTTNEFQSVDECLIHVKNIIDNL